jgi:probable HAF family extracellular repeat protein
MPVYSYVTIDDPLAGTNPLIGGTDAFGINDNGQIVGGYFDSNGFGHGFLLSGGSYIPVDDPLATNGSVVHGINASGQIVGAYGSGGGAHGFLDSGGTFTTLDDPSSNGLTYAYGGR